MAVSRLAARPQAVAPRGSTGLGILAAALFFVPAALLAWTIGPELPSICGALAGGLLFVLLVRRCDAVSQHGALSPAPPPGALAMAALPYLIVFALILATRLFDPLAEWLRAVALGWSQSAGFGGTFQPLYHPGTMLLIAFVAAGVALRSGRRRLPTLAGAAVRRWRSRWWRC